MQKPSLFCRKRSAEGVDLWLVLLQTVRAIAKHVAIELQSNDLGDSDFRVLEVLLHKGALSVNTLGPEVNLTPGSISVAVDRLYGRGLVSRIEDANDRRIRIVDLTPEGKKLIAPVFRRHAANLEKVMEVLSSSERSQLEALLKKIGRNAESLSAN